LKLEIKRINPVEGVKDHKKNIITIAKPKNNIMSYSAEFRKL